MKIITANGLLDGGVVWLGTQNNWVTNIDHAKILKSDTDAEKAMKIAEYAVDNRQIVEPYVVEVDSTDGMIVPKSVKEKIRSKGPTTRLDLGKQSEANTLAA